MSSPNTPRRIREDEAERLREIRLRLLADVSWRSRDLAAERTFDAGFWVARARAVAQAADRAAFVVESSEGWLGIVETMPAKDPEAAEVHGFWVDPRARRQGHGLALLSAAVEWAEERRYERLVSWVRERNGPAIAAHSRAGFRLTGRVIRWPDRAAWQVYMVRALAPFPCPATSTSSSSARFLPTKAEARSRCPR